MKVHIRVLTRRLLLECFDNRGFKNRGLIFSTEILRTRHNILRLQPQSIRYHNHRKDEESVINTTRRNVFSFTNFIRRQISQSFYRFEDWLLQDVQIHGSEIFMDFDELLDAHGYAIENHTVKTEDGYILTVHRVSKKKEAFCNNKSEYLGKKPVVLLVHGFQCSSIHWFLNDKDKTLPFMLLEQGYDCWFANLRGSPHSKIHSKFLNTSRQFWDFSWHEMGYYDIPATIDHIIQCTGSESLHYVGHSMGCTVFFLAMAEKPEYCSKIKGMVALAPAVFMDNVRNKFVTWVVAPAACVLGRSPFFRQQQIFQNEFATLAANFSPPASCSTRLGGFMLHKYGMIFGGLGGSDQMQATQIAQLSRHWPQSTSAKALYHGMQCLISKKFQNYDYGKNENLLRYGQSNSPVYDLSLVTCPVATFYAMNDELCTSVDVHKLSENLPNMIGNFGVTLQSFNHADFMFGKDAHSLVYINVVNILSKTDKRDKISSSIRSSA